MNTVPDPSLGRVLDGGADVRSIAETSVAVVVDELIEVAPWRHPAWPLCRALGALGFGAIRIYGGENIVDDLSDLMRGAVFAQAFALHALANLAREATPSDLVFYLGNDATTRERCASASRTMRAPFHSISWGTTWLVMHSGTVGEEAARATSSLPREGSREPLYPVACVAAGLALQEALIVAGRLSAAVPPAHVVTFNAALESRTVPAGEELSPTVWVEDAIIDVIGAGGVGTNLLESLAPHLGPGCELRIYDFDEVGVENLAVQPAFSAEDVGLPKAIVMAERLAQLCDPAVEISPFVTRYEERPGTLATPSLRVACPDNWAARAHANTCALADGVPLVEAGSSPLAAQHRSYVPGRTACLEHRVQNLSRRAANERDRAPCSQQQAWTLPGTNLVCGGILASEALRALEPEQLGMPSAGTIVYDARWPARFGVVGVRPPCSHQESRSIGETSFAGARAGD